MKFGISQSIGRSGETANPALNLAPFGRWTLRVEAAQRRLALRKAFQAMPEDFKRARNRKQSTKLARSKQLGIDSPPVIEVQL